MRIRLFAQACWVLCAVLIFGGCGGSSSSGAHYATIIAEGRAAVKDAMTETGATAVSVALVDNGRVVWSEAFGSADRESGRNADTTTLFGICSVSKMLATVATMILVDRGQVALDEPVTTYIKDFNMPLDPRYRDITVRMLLNHSSGLPGNDSRASATLTPFTGYAAQVMEGLKYQRLKHDPGAMSEYNNDGFTMMDNLVRAVTGQAYPDFVRENILAPLGMNSSRYMTGPLPEGTYAHPYGWDTRLIMYYLNVYSTGGLFSTPEELSRLAIMLMNRGVYGSRRILSEKSVAAMAQDQRLGSFNPVPYAEMEFGLGWDTVAQPGLSAVGVTTWQKTGDMGGYYGANMAVAPDEKLAVVVFGASNGFDSAHAVKISERILLRALVVRGRLASMPTPLSPPSLPVKPVTADAKNSFAGYYASGTTAYRLSFGSDDALSVDEYQADWTPKYRNLKLRMDGWYAADNDPLTAVRLLTRAGHTYFAVRMRRGYGHYTIAILFGQRIDARPAISAAWLARLNEPWLPVNNPWSLVFGDPSFSFRTINGLTGYLMGKTILRDMSPASDARLDGMFMTLPDGGRDLVDAAIETWNGEDMLRLGSCLYRPMSSLQQLATGSSTVTIGSDGFTEWRRLPVSGKLAISGDTSWTLYNANFKVLASGTGSGSCSFTGSNSNYLALAGTVGAPIVLKLTP